MIELPNFVTTTNLFDELSSTGVLPNVVRNKIFSFCSEESLKNLSLVSSKFSQLFWESLCWKEVPVQTNLVKMSWKQFYQDAIHSHKYKLRDPTLIRIMQARSFLCPYNQSCTQSNLPDAVSPEEGPIKLLPNDLYRYLFSFCSAKDLGNLSSVSSKICQLIKNHPTIWWSLCLKEIYIESPSMKISWKQFYINAINPDQYRHDKHAIVVRCANTKETSEHNIDHSSDWVQINHFKRIIRIDKGLTCSIDKMHLVCRGKIMQDVYFLKTCEFRTVVTLFLMLK